MANTKKNIKVRDLKPSKDAKGGGGRVNSGRTAGGHTAGGHTLGGHTLGGKTNDKHSLGHQGGGHT